VGAFGGKLVWRVVAEKQCMCGRAIVKQPVLCMPQKGHALPPLGGVGAPHCLHFLHSKCVVALAVKDLAMYGVQNQRLGGRPQLATNLKHPGGPHSTVEVPLPHTPDTMGARA
jgi:hypothetical protein